MSWYNLCADSNSTTNVLQLPGGCVIALNVRGQISTVYRPGVKLEYISNLPTWVELHTEASVDDETF